MQKIIHISAECYPIAKIGGLADVVGALPKYQNKLGNQASVIMPFYNIPFIQKNEFECVYESVLSLDNDSYKFRVLKPIKLSLGFDLFLIDVPELLFKDYIYSFDDSERFLAFQIAALKWLLTLNDKPSILHCHDHHTGLIPFMMQQCNMFSELKKIPSVLTIHNAQYQGWFSHEKIKLIPEFDLENVGLIDWNGNINPLAAAIKCAWKVNTVSPSYMEELKVSANGLESLLSHEYEKCIGILNGIDTNVWNTETDSFITKKYSISTNISGKKANKRELCKAFNLDVKKPLFVFIGRLVEEKGSDLFPEAFDIALKNNDISILLLGSGDKATEEKLEKLKDKHIGNYNAFIGYDEKLSHNIYAGADFLLMPSRVEPCGLNQMYSLRYGTIPVVRNIGGLKDTIVDVSEEGFGFIHQNTSVDDICNVIERAAHFYKNEKEFKKIKKRIMNIDHSWDSSAKKYIQLYQSIKQ